MLHVPVPPVAVLLSFRKPDRVWSRQLCRIGSRGLARAARNRTSRTRAHGVKTGSPDRLVHAAARTPADRSATRAAGPLPHSDAVRRRRVQLHPPRRYAAPLSTYESSARAAAVLRDLLRPPAAHLQLYLCPRAGSGAGAGLAHVRPSLGRRGAFCGRSMRPLLLDAAGLDHARLGAARRAVGGDPVRPPQPVDEQLLGRRGVRGCGLSRVWIVAPAEGALAPARCRSAGRGDRSPSAHAAL